MAQPDDLQLLVSSLEKSEKRYFKLYARFYSAEDTNKSIQLFDLIDKMEPYDEKVLLEQYRAKNIGANLSSAKYELHNLILRSLTAYNSGKSVNADLREMISQIEILFHKGLYQGCRKVLERAQKKAEHFEKYPYVMEILVWRRRLLIAHAADAMEADLEDFYGEMKIAVNHLLSSAQYWDLMDRVQEAGRRYARARSKDEYSALQALVENPLLKSREQAISFAARISFWHSLGQFERLNGNVEDSRLHYLEATREFERHPQHIEDQPELYKQYLTNYLSCCIVLKKFDEIESILQKIKYQPVNSFYAGKNLVENVYYLELYYYLNTGEILEGLKLMPSLEAALDSHGAAIRPNRFIAICHNAGMVNFLAGEYRKSLDFVVRIQQQSTRVPRSDIQKFVVVFRLILHFELKDFDILDNLFRTSYRYLKNRNAYAGFEKEVLGTVRKLVSAPERRFRTRILKTLRLKLEQLLEASDAAGRLGVPETLAWVVSKIEERSIVDVYREMIRDNR